MSKYCVIFNEYLLDSVSVFFLSSSLYLDAAQHFARTGRGWIDPVHLKEAVLCALESWQFDWIELCLLQSVLHLPLRVWEELGFVLSTINEK